jgi:hypothetical protein
MNSFAFAMLGGWGNILRESNPFLERILAWNFSGQVQDLNIADGYGQFLTLARNRTGELQEPHATHIFATLKSKIKAVKMTVRQGLS